MRATTLSPAPIAKRISVAEGPNETMRWIFFCGTASAEAYFLLHEKNVKTANVIINIEEIRFDILSL